MRADKAVVGRLLRTARGQIDGVLRMMEEDRYCMDISNQIEAAQAVLRRANLEVLRAHIESCVTDAIRSGGGEAEQKIGELLGALDKLVR